MEEEIKTKSPVWYLIAIFLLLIMVLSFIPYFWISEDPWPSQIPQISEVYTGGAPSINKSFNRYDYKSKVTPNEPMVKDTANKLVSLSCDSSKICHAKAAYLFVRDRFIYISEQDEYIQTPQQMLYTQGGDCDDHAVLLANLLQAVGIPTRFVYVPRHVYIKAYLPSALNKYQTDGWIRLDPTCKNCDFGEIPIKYRDLQDN